MNSLNFSMIALVGAISFLFAYSALYLLAWIENRTRRKARSFLKQTKDPVVFLFEDEEMVNATQDARRMLRTTAKHGSDWARLTSLLLPRFPNLSDDMANLAEYGTIELRSADETSTLLAEWRDGLARVSLTEAADSDSPASLDKHSLASMEREIENLRTSVDSAPFLLWREAENGSVTWANTAYLETAESFDIAEGSPSWPPRRLFDTRALALVDSSDVTRRLKLQMPDSQEVRWFECHRVSLGPDALFTAINADKVVRAESESREFVQTLTKTFSHLTIGLAIFDKTRRLGLFNPAMSDLTALPAEFMSSRPTLSGFLDRMRENQMMPEPKDYRSWRQNVEEMETAAENGTYEDTWSLPSGQTYRVTGRPHPDGAIAFLIEDISAEISLTRRFRAELETGQAVIDSLEEAIAVFSANGMLIMTNSAYSGLWGSDHDTTLREISVLDATNTWHERCAPTPVWSDLRDFVSSREDRAEWLSEARMWDGRRLNCRISPLSGGKTLVGFSPLMRSDAPSQVLTAAATAS
jgi:PAS domain-containing protein